VNPNFLQNYAHYNTSCLQETKQQTTPTPQNRSSRSQKFQELDEVQKVVQKSPNLPHQIKK
jgi:hypothetical protein